MSERTCVGRYSLAGGREVDCECCGCSDVVVPATYNMPPNAHSCGLYSSIVRSDEVACRRSGSRAA